MTFRTKLECYCLFINSKGFEDWRHEPKFDATFDDDASALAYMDEITDRDGITGDFHVFRVESWEVDE